jgi:hypothetical protein
MARRKKQAELVVWFSDPAPFGCGMRGVNVVTVGPKWARIEHHVTKDKARLKRAVWEEITRAAERRRERFRAS